VHHCFNDLRQINLDQILICAGVCAGGKKLARVFDNF
jgi:hypothetical protein